MTTGKRFGLAFACALTLLGSLFYGVHRVDRGAWGEPRLDRRAAVTARPGPAEPAGARIPSSTEAGPAGGRKGGSPANVAGTEPAVTGWTVSGRIVRAAGPASTPETVPAAGVLVSLKPHLRGAQTSLADAPVPGLSADRTTGTDGRFELTGAPGKVWHLLQIDDGASALRTLSFELPEGDGRRDLGDIALEPAAAFAVQLVGARGELIANGTVLVGRDSSQRSPALHDLGFHESRREAEPRGNGTYALERAVAGLLTVVASAPGHLTSDALTVEVPRRTPLVIQLGDAARISGIVMSSDGQAIGGAEVQAPDAGEASRALTDADGRFVLDTIPPGDPCRVTVDAAGFLAAQRDGVEPETADLELRLEPEATLAGTVVSDEGGSAVAGAEVSLRQRGGGQTLSAKTDHQGRFRIGNAVAGTYTITADHPDFEPLELPERKLDRGERMEDQILELSKGLRASGRVLDALTRAPIAGAQVFCQLREEGKPAGTRRSATTDASGRFAVIGLLEGTHDLAAEKEGYLPQFVSSVAVSRTGGPDLTILLEQGGSIAGRVVDPEGNPVEGAQVRTVDPIAQTKTDAGGRFRLSGLAPKADYAVTAAHEQYLPGSVEGVTVEPRQPVEDLEIRLSRGGSIEGRIVDEQGREIEGVAVQAIRAQARGLEAVQGVEAELSTDLYPDGFHGSFSSSSLKGRFVHLINPITTDAAGNFVIPLLEPGTYTVRASAPERLPASREEVAVTVDCTAAGIDLVLSDGESLAGKVLDGDGKPIDGVQVLASAPGGQGTPREADTDVQGRFVLRGLDSGKVSLSVASPSHEAQALEVMVPGEEVVVTLRGATETVSAAVAEEAATATP